MKKLIKKSLNELAEIMPVLSEKNQHECVGGTYFVDASGAFMYQNSMTDYAGQATDTIKVISGVDISGFQRAEMRKFL